MLIPFLFAFAGLCWLAHRFSSLISISLEKAVKTLNVCVPNVPLISIDKVSFNRIALHWDSGIGRFNSEAGKNAAGNVSNSSNTPDGSYEGTNSGPNTEANIEGPRKLPQVSPHAISHYVLYINGLQTAIIDGNKQSCVLNGLTPDTNYQVDLVAFNMTNFRSRSCPIYVKTAARDDPKFAQNGLGGSLDHPDALLRTLVPDPGDLIVHEAFKSRSRSSTIDGGSSFGFDSANNSGVQQEPTRTPPNLITDINELKFLLESGLEEVKCLIRSHRNMETEFKEEEEALILARREAKQRRKIEDSNRANLRQEIKYLEEQRMKSENKLSANRQKLNVRLKKIHLKEDQIDAWNKEIDKMKEEKRTILEKDHPEQMDKLQYQIQELNKVSFSSRQICKPVFYSRKVRKTLEKLLLLKPDWSKELTDEVLTIDKQMEAEWKELQKKEFGRVEMLRNSRNSSYSNGVSNPDADSDVKWSESTSDLNRLLPQSLIDDDFDYNVGAVRQPVASAAQSPVSSAIPSQDVSMDSPVNFSSVGVLQQPISNSYNSSLNVQPISHDDRNISGLSQPQSSDFGNSNSTAVGHKAASSLDILAGLYNNDMNASNMNYSTITSLSALASKASEMAANQNSGVMSPQSLRAVQLHPTDSAISASLLDMGNTLGMPSNRRSMLDGFSRISSAGGSIMALGSSPPTQTDPAIGLSVSNSQFSRLFSSPTNDIAAARAGNVGTVSPVDRGRSSLEYVTRARSTSFGSSIWSNGGVNSKGINANNHESLGNPDKSESSATNIADWTVGSGWGTSMGNLGEPISLVASSSSAPRTAPESMSNKDSKQHNHNWLHNWGLSSATDESANGSSKLEEGDSLKYDEEQHQGSQSFFKNKIFKFGMTPTKAKNSAKSGPEITVSEDKDAVDNQSNTDSPRSGESNGHLGSGFGSRSSRIFKLGSRKASFHSMGSGKSNISGETSGSTAVGEDASVNEDGENNHSGGKSGKRGSSGSDSSSGSVFSRKLSFPFKKDKEKEEASGRLEEVKEEDEEDSDKRRVGNEESEELSGEKSKNKKSKKRRKKKHKAKKKDEAQD
ncbi:hypothetical protein HII12_003671 [Brettanomyces bruxellensis]|uniref:Fibronectin type-III domain-containing protein n=1 Tax=Dekkera bruxellensis TaxID=5007 RepID=A0A8H6ET18_DEKBR|nr:hypothetical protein HII12_003671 [Brettanomyces bruxellensis]